MKPKKAIKNIVVGAAFVSILSWAGFSLVEKTWDHENNLCPFNSFLPLWHNEVAINIKADSNTKAYHVEDGSFELTIPVRQVIIDGQTYNVAPMGYEVQDGLATKTINVPDDCVVVVTDINNDITGPVLSRIITKDEMTKVR